MNLTRSVQYVTIRVPHCSLTYGTAPCTASLTASPPTGTRKCFNSLATCQDRANFTDVPSVMVFVEDVSFVLRTPEHPAFRDLMSSIATGTYPLIKKIDYQPAIVSLGGELGQRATMKVTFRDAPHSDAGPDFDKYPGDRDYNDPYSRGTFWGKFRARNPFLRGRPLTYASFGFNDATFNPNFFENRNFLIDSIDGPAANGDFSIIAKDALKLADGDRSVAPPLSNGFLNANITNVATTLTLSPSGIGAQYGSAGVAAIGGKECVSYTAVGDTLTITRAQFNTTAQAHSAGDRVQSILWYPGLDPAFIIWHLLTNYAAVPADYINLDDWESETAGFLGTVYTLVLCEPESVADIISELITQMGAAIWWDDVNQKIRLQILRNIAPGSQRYNEDNVIADSLQVREQPEKRISQVIVYFGQVNPLLKKDETSNYRSTELQEDTQSAIDEGSAAIKKIFARGIAQGGRTVATRVAQKHLSRYVRPPRRFNFSIPKYNDANPTLGAGVFLGGGDPRVPSWPFQDDTGARVEIPCQITSQAHTDDMQTIEAEEILFTQYSEEAIDITNKTIILDANEFNVNMRTRHDSIFPAPLSGDTITCIVTTGVIIGSTDTAVPAIHVGDWPSGVTLNLRVRGRIQAMGGAGGGQVPGGTGGPAVGPGQPGGVALYTRENINVLLDEGEGEIWGGGGGGRYFFAGLGFLGGGGGAGYNGGPGGVGTVDNGDPGTTEAGGAGGNSGANNASAGGGPGLPGGGANNFGAAGVAIDGVSFCTFTGTGDRRGGEIN